jgi:hypothetical protein
VALILAIEIVDDDLFRAEQDQKAKQEQKAKQDQKLKQEQKAELVAWLDKVWRFTDQHFIDHKMKREGNPTCWFGYCRRDGYHNMNL